MGKNDLDGQLNLFGSDPYQPKKAKANEEQVELSTEAEEFLSVGRRKKKAPEKKVPEEKAPEEKVPEEKAPEEKVPEEKAPEEKVPEEKVPEEKAPEEKPPASGTAQVKKPKEAPPKANATKTKTHVEAVVMQQSFINASGRTATVAYVDYNCVYVQEPTGKAAMTHYPDAKIAVDRYLETVARFSKTEGMKKSKEHPLLKTVSCEEAE